jgi:glycosyltransferase involved in cell wall biosynthesis
VNVYFHGMVQDRNVIYSSIDALVVTSETEGLSLAIIEAMAYGCAVIASNVGGNPKLIEQDVNGWLFEYDDNKTLSEFIHTLQTQQALLSTFGKAGRQKIEQQFSLDNCADKYSEIYFVNDADSR